MAFLIGFCPVKDSTISEQPNPIVPRPAAPILANPKATKGVAVLRYQRQRPQQLRLLEQSPRRLIKFPNQANDRWGLEKIHRIIQAIGKQVIALHLGKVPANWLSTLRNLLVVGSY